MDVFYRANVTDGLFHDKWSMEDGKPHGRKFVPKGFILLCKTSAFLSQNISQLGLPLTVVTSISSNNGFKVVIPRLVNNVSKHSTHLFIFLYPIHQFVFSTFSKTEKKNNNQISNRLLVSSTNLFTKLQIVVFCTPAISLMVHLSTDLNISHVISLEYQLQEPSPSPIRNFHQNKKKSIDGLPMVLLTPVLFRTRIRRQGQDLIS